MSLIVAFRRSALVIAAASALVNVCAAEDASQSGVTHGIIQVTRDQQGTLSRTVFNNAISLNWSGYVNANFNTQVTYTAAQATWTVPAVTLATIGHTAPPLQLSSTWVGVGGYCEVSNCTSRDSTLIQLGTSQQATSSVPTYYAWYEMLPAAPVPIPRVIAPGDSVTATLTCADPCTANTTQSWTLTMADTTRNWTWSTTVQYSSSLLSSEWIMEAPTSSTYGILPLPNYTLEKFNPISANGLNPSLPAADAITMVNPWGQTSNPSTPTSGNEFNTCWATGYKPAACTAP